VDGVGAIAQKMVSLAVLQRSATVQTASDFAVCAEKVLKNIKVFFSPEHHITPDDIKMLDNRWSQVQAYRRISSISNSEKDASCKLKNAIGDFVKVVLFSKSKKNSENFVGQIKQIDGNDIQLEYLKRVSDNVYVWPNKPEISWEKIAAIVEKLPTPEIINSRLEMKFIHV
jgi:hypothetical protein